MVRTLSFDVVKNLLFAPFVYYATRVRENWFSHSPSIGLPYQLQNWASTGSFAYNSQSEAGE